MLLPSCDTECYFGLIPLILSGFAYTIFAGILWAVLPSVTSPKLIGTAYGICGATLNIGLAIVPTLGGYIHDQTLDYSHGFFWVILSNF